MHSASQMTYEFVIVSSILVNRHAMLAMGLKFLKRTHEERKHVGVLDVDLEREESAQQHESPNIHTKNH